MPAITKTSSSRPTPPWRPHNRNSPPQQGKGGNVAAAMTPACPKPTKNQSYAEPVQLSRPEYPSQSPTHHADTQISPITLKSSASKTPREKSGLVTVLQISDAGLQRRARGVLSTGILVALVDAGAFLHVCRCRIDRSHDCAGDRIGCLARMDRPARKCQPVSLRTSSLSLHTSPQVVNEVDLCDQTEEFTGFHDNGDAVRPEDWYERVERLVRFDNL